MAELLQTPERYLRAPQLFVRDGTLHLVAIAWLPEEGEALLEASLSELGEVVHERLGERHGAVCGIEVCEGAPRAVREPAPESSVRVGRRRLQIRETAANDAEVWLERDGASPVLVFRSPGTIAAPCVLPAPCGGDWVAVHHDVREDDGQVDVAKWIAVFFVDAEGRVFEPAASMRDRDRDREGVEQSFEFPSLALADDGALSIFGRGSHNFWRQDLSAEGYGPRVALSDGEWGSRGRRVGVCVHEGGLFTARRERRAIVVERLEPAHGGAPVLQPYVPRAPSSRPRVEAGREAHDPARRHGRVTLFGDIQQHSAHSDGVGSAEEVYRRARVRYGDDFVALTDHESFLGKRTGPGEWAYLQAVADAADDPGAFNSLIAYEWTGKMFPGPGHKCVYYPRAGLPIVSRDDVPEGGALVERVKALGGFASPHHIGWTGADEAGHDPEGQPLWEICSCHGCYEHADHSLGQRGELHDQLVDVMLKRGHRFGFTASSDSHGLLWHHGEARKRDPYRTGLTAVQALSRTRGAIMDALVERRAYATSGAKILLDVTADGRPMGSELPSGEAHVSVRAYGEAELARVELVGPDGVLADGRVQGREGGLELTCVSPFAYARVVQRDGEMAWSSPLFFG